MNIKRIFVFCLAVICLTVQFVLPAMAEDSCLDNGTEIIYFDDGSYITITPVIVIDESANTRASAVSKTGSKVASYTDSDGNVDWKYTLTATFSYVSGSSSTCTSASYTKTIYDSSWEFSNGSATKSGNKATGKGTFKDKVLFVTMQTKDVNITITCDTYGNLT